MAMSNAERQRKFRQNRDSNLQKRQEYLQKEKDRNSQRREKGKRKLVKDMTEREKRAARKLWKLYKRNGRARAKAQNDILTPPNSPEVTNVNETSRQKKQSSRKKNREMAKCYRDNKQLKQQLKKQTLLAKKYKKRTERQKEAMKQLENKTDTPRTKTRKLLRLYPKKTVRKTLIFQSALIDQIKEKYRHRLKKGQKKEIEEILYGSILRKYKVKTAAKRMLGICLRNERVKERNSLSRRMYSSVKEFFERDDISRITTGIKNTVTHNKEKKQRRVLNDSLKNLHAKFLSENPETISYKTFCRLRPFWVKFPTNSDRSTCLCKLCDNTQLMASALKKASIMSNDNLEEISRETVCDIKEHKCMFKNCLKCENKRINFTTELGNEEIEWEEWQIKTEKRVLKVGKNLQEKDVTFTTKETLTGTVNELCEKFENQIDRYNRHLFIYRWQCNYLRTRKEHLQENECILHVDFSENYEGKMPSEVQGMNFGASKKQISLHTGVIYTGASSNYQTFCTVSDNLHHGPGGIWAHLKPVLNDIKKQYPNINSVEFFSDGPTSQYRQKFNFYMLASEIYKLGFTKAEWNFFEAGHGKGVPDAVGGSLKRKADHKVKYGSTIMSAKSFVNILNKSGTKLFEISETEIEDTRNDLKKTSPRPIPGTLKLHQLKTFCPGSLFYREVSCECVKPNECEDHNLKKHIFQDLFTEKWVSQDAVFGDTEIEQANEENGEKLNQRGNETDQDCKQKYKTRNKSTERVKMSKTQNRSTKGLKMKHTGQEKGTGRKMHKLENKQTLKGKNIDEMGHKKLTGETRNEMENKKSCEGEIIKMGSTRQTEGEKRSNKRTEEQLKDSSAQDYPMMLNELLNCKGFEQLKIKCQEISVNFSELPAIPQSVSFSSSNLEVDVDAMDLYPNDVPDERVLYPCTVPADGNCLPSSGSVYGYGCPDFSAEMRIRILCELVLYEDTYLDNNFLLQGLPQNEQGRCIIKSYAMYSDMWVPGMLLNNNMIKSIYRMELHKIRKNNSYMGIWQIHALSSVLKVPIYSVYPQNRSTELRRDLNRLILPRQSNQNQTPVYIFWTSTRDNEMVHEHWRPNHFVPCLPVYESTVYSSVSGVNRVVSSPNDKIQDEVFKVEHIDLTSEELNSKDKADIITFKERTVRKTETDSIKEEDGIETETDSRRDTDSSNVRPECSEMETEDNNETENIMTETEDITVGTEDTKMKSDGSETVTKGIKIGLEETKMETEDIKMERDTNKGRAKQGKMKAEDIVESEDEKLRTEDSETEEIRGTDDQTETNHSKMEMGDSKKTQVEINDRKLEMGDSKMEMGDSMEIQVETNDSKMENEECKMEMGDSKETQVETNDNNMEMGDSKETHMETNDSNMETVDSKETQKETNNSKMKMGDSIETQMEKSDHKMEMGDCKMGKRDNKETQMETNGSKIEMGDSKLEMGGIKIVIEESKEADRRKVLEDRRAVGDVIEINRMETEVYKEQTEAIKMITDTSKMETSIPQPIHCIGKYVIVKYGNHAYPGIVEDAGEYDVFVMCMHGVGRKNSNRFYWPKKIIDRCWYDHENILAVIPEPTKITGSFSHYKIEENIWDYIIMQLNKKE